MSRAEVDVLVVTYNSDETVERCIASIPATAGGMLVRTHVWDNASGDATTEMIARATGRSPALELHSSEVNIGFAAACNRLLATSEGEVVCLLNPDVELGPEVLERLVETVRSDHSVGLATARLETADGRPQPEAARPRPTLLGVVLGGLGAGAARRRLSRRKRLFEDHDTECAMGALLVARRSVLDAVDGMDESVFMYLEDVDLCRRVREAGLRIAYLGSLVAHHVSGASRAGMEEFLDTLGPLVWITYFGRYGRALERLALRPALSTLYAGRGLAALLAGRPRAALLSVRNAGRALTVRGRPRRGYTPPRQTREAEAA